MASQRGSGNEPSTQSGGGSWNARVSFQYVRAKAIRQWISARVLRRISNFFYSLLHWRPPAACALSDFNMSSVLLLRSRAPRVFSFCWLVSLGALQAWDTPLGVPPILLPSCTFHSTRFRFKKVLLLLLLGVIRIPSIVFEVGQHNAHISQMVGSLPVTLRHVAR